MHFGEVDEISDEDLEASADYYQRILNETLPHKQAERIASKQYGVILDNNLLNRIMQNYSCSDSSLEDCVRAGLGKTGLLNKD
jgi:hypothetical protein